LTKYVLYKTRPVGTLAIPIIATTLFAGAWLKYYINRYEFPTLYEPHPTNIIGKVVNLKRYL
jgi:hypothetical protein